VLPREGRPAKLVFGLPGNPVSSFVCFELFVRPVIRRLMGLNSPATWIEAALEEGVTYKSDRPTYHPARVQLAGTGWGVRLVPWLGSWDLRGMTAGNALALLPMDRENISQGSMVRAMMLDEVWL